MMIFPQSVRVTSCSVVSAGITCVRDTLNSQMITLKNFLTKDYIPGGDPIVFTVGEVINPMSTEPADDLEIQILAEGKYVVDEYIGITPWPLKTGRI